MKYFGHDTCAWKDEKIGALCYDGGLEAYGLYFVVLELIYEEEGPVNLAETEPLTKSVARWFGVGSDSVASLVKSMVSHKLLKRVKGPRGSLFVTSERAEQNIERYHEKCETARQNGKKGGRKPSGNRTANQLGTEPLTKRKANKNKKEKVLDSYKAIQIPTASADADAETAPRNAEGTLPTCPRCGVPLKAEAKGGRMGWECPEHGEIPFGEWVVKEAADA